MMHNFDMWKKLNCQKYYTKTRLRFLFVFYSLYLYLYNCNPFDKLKFIIMIASDSALRDGSLLISVQCKMMCRHPRPTISHRQFQFLCMFELSLTRESS